MDGGELYISIFCFHVALPCRYIVTIALLLEFYLPPRTYVLIQCYAFRKRAH